MESAKSVGLTLPTNYKLSKYKCLKTKADKAEMSKVPYAAAVGSLIHVMVCTRLDIGYAIPAKNIGPRSGGYFGT